MSLFIRTSYLPIFDRVVIFFMVAIFALCIIINCKVFNLPIKVLTKLYRLLLSSGIVVTTSIGVATSIAGCKHSKKGVLEGLQQFAKADHALILRWFPEDKRKTFDTDVVTAVRKAILSEDKTGCFNKDNIKKLTLSPEGILADEGKSSQIEVQYGTQKQKIYIATEKNPHEVLSLLGTVSKIPFSLPFLKPGLTINDDLIEAQLRSILAHHILQEDVSIYDLDDVHFSYVKGATNLLPGESYKILFTYKTYNLEDEARVITVNVQKHAAVSKLSEYTENTPLTIPHFSDKKVA